MLAAAVFSVYALFSSTVTDTFCSRYYYWESYTGLGGFMLAQALLQVRIYALYSSNKKILVFMLICYLSLSGVSAWIVQAKLASSKASAISLPMGKVCIDSNISPGFYTFWIPVLLFDSMLCALAIFGGLRGFTTASSFFRRGLSLVQTLILGSVFYYIAIAVSYLACLLLWRFGPQGLIDAPVGFAATISYISANRVLFNLLEANQNKLVFILSDA